MEGLGALILAIRMHLVIRIWLHTIKLTLLCQWWQQKNLSHLR